MPEVSRTAVFLSTSLRHAFVNIVEPFAHPACRLVSTIDEDEDGGISLAELQNWMHTAIPQPGTEAGGNDYRERKSGDG